MGGTAKGLPSGTRLGPYEIRELIGRGGMGEVYRARDTRLGRDVAVKVLKASAHSDRYGLRRFLQEAQATSALSHQNIVTVYDVGPLDDGAYIVCELLRGETLRQVMKRGPLAVKQALDYAGQVASGLAAAHRKGILHRDIKPENLFVTSHGVVKILDFGLTKLTFSPEDSRQATRVPSTAPGILLGTPGYVSPEQIREQPVDPRTDIFSLGVVLYEALAGRPPFKRESVADTLSAILREEPVELRQSRPDLPTAVEQVVRGCLEKNVDERFQSAGDLALSLKLIVPLLESERMRPVGAEATLRAPGRTWMVAALGVIAVVVGIFAALASSTPAAGPSYQRVTFARGSIGSARFNPRSGEIFYTGAFNGEPPETFVTVPGASEARRLGIRDAEILSIARDGQVALSLNRRLLRGYVHTGTLAVMREGQLPREILEGVHLADWTPDSTALAIVREVRGRSRLEFPIDNVLFETSGWISDVRFSPDGNHVAFVNHPVSGLGGGAIFVTRTDGRPRALSGAWDTILGLGWTPAGDELWFTAADDDGVEALRAIDLAGRARVVVHGPGTLRLLDIAADGRVLIKRDDVRLEAIGARPGDPLERNWSWLDWSLARDISADGSHLLIVEAGDGVGAAPAVSYIRRSDGSPATRLGVGSALALSPDGERALTIVNNRLVLLPVGTGDTITLPHHETTYHPAAGFFPDGQNIVFTGSESGHGTRIYVQAISGSTPRAITPEGFRLSSPGSVSPDGLSVVAEGDDERLFLVSSSGGQPQLLRGGIPGDAMARWDPTGRAVFVFQRAQVPTSVFRLSLDGRRELWRTMTPADLTGASAIHRLVMTPRGDAYAYTLERQLSDMYIARGLPQRPLRASISAWLTSAE